MWRGPKKTAMVRQFLSDTNWAGVENGNRKGVDYLLVDTPPGECGLNERCNSDADGKIGTSDEHISLAEEMRRFVPRGAVIVTTPQAVATADVRKELNFCKKVGIDVLGVVENMSGFVCPHCAECTDVFSSGGGEKMAEEFGVRFLGAVPIEPKFGLMVESQKEEGEKKGVGLGELYKECELSKVFEGITKEVVRIVEEKVKASV